jgi:hypothetical protein
VAAANGAQVVNNPFWWSADDKFLDNVVARTVGVAVPRTILLPHRDHPPNTAAESFSNLEFPLDWEAVFAHLGFPIFLKPAYGGGWRDVYKVHDPGEFFGAYARTHSLCMMAQEAIEFTDYFRCYCVGRAQVRIMRYDPRQPHERRYVHDAPPLDHGLEARLTRDCLALCDALGYDLNTLEFALRDGTPYAIDFMNPAPDADLHSVGPDNFAWVVEAVAALLIERALAPRPLELTGSWPARQNGARRPAAPRAAREPAAGRAGARV